MLRVELLLNQYSIRVRKWGKERKIEMYLLEFQCNHHIQFALISFHLTSKNHAIIEDIKRDFDVNENSIFDVFSSHASPQIEFLYQFNSDLFLYYFSSCSPFIFGFW